jgi:16S rRNA (guanine966-N2)-methyltransferase
MRITGGELGGRRLTAPAGPDMRPTQDRVRAALFNMLAPRMPGCRFLDLFAGSGLVGIEASSRGATEVAWVESHPRACAALRANLAALGIAGGTVYRMDARAFLRRAAAAAPWDVIFADPPYKTVNRPVGGHTLAEELLSQVADNGHLADAGLFILEVADAEEVPAPAGWTLRDNRRYGGTRLLVWARAAAGS